MIGTVLARSPETSSGIANDKNVASRVENFFNVK
jgi:hypothetical protein